MKHLMEYPRIIQGGMGVAVSSWNLARAVSLRGQLGVVSGTALDLVLARRLQTGDMGGHIAEALAQFPIKDMADRIWDRYFVPGGKADDEAFKSKPVHAIVPGKALTELMVVASFVEVWLAKRGHSGVVGINLLEKIQLPTLPTLFGAMMAGVDYVLMGAGIPRAIPGVLDKMAKGEPCELPIEVVGGNPLNNEFPTQDFWLEPLKRPKFLAIVSSFLLAQLLAKKCTPPADGFVIEGPTAGGHNAPPRGAMQLTEAGEPLYGERDVPDLAKFRELGLPFWLAGSFGSHEKLIEARNEGAEGIQVGTAFAFCNESGILPSIKREVIRRSKMGQIKVFTDPKASPTGFPFKVVQVEGTASDPQVIKERHRICDLGYLREAYQRPDGKIGYRCAAEPIEDYVAKGGEESNTVGRKCVCNGLMSTIGLGQVRKGVPEPALLTAGDDAEKVGRFAKGDALEYSCDDVIDELLGISKESEVLVTPAVVHAV